MICLDGQKSLTRVLRVSDKDFWFGGGAKLRFLSGLLVWSFFVHSQAQSFGPHARPDSEDQGGFLSPSFLFTQFPRRCDFLFARKIPNRRTKENPYEV